MKKKHIRTIAILLIAGMLLAMAPPVVQAEEVTHLVTSAFYEAQEPVAMAASETVSNSSLNKAEKWLLDDLKGKVRKVADGSQTSTSFEIPVPDSAGLNWTAKECGVSSFTSANVSASVKERLSGKLNILKVWRCLLFEMPYELYWHDKMIGGIKYQYALEYTTDSVVITKMNISLTVNAKYAKQGENSSYYLYETNLSDAGNRKRIKDATDQAKAIVAEAKNLSDVEKIKYYVKRICELNTYNREAALSSNTNNLTDGIDPWQLIYVFDQDPDTNVVCEGYAKAFAWLCELTTFQDSRIACYLVSGNMTGGTGAGGHMWNVVTMDDGENYLVDVTNCDAGTTGYPDKLCLAALPKSAEGNYIYQGGGKTMKFSYNEETREIYGTGADSILNLKQTDSYAVYQESGKQTETPTEKPETKPQEQPAIVKTAPKITNVVCKNKNSLNIYMTSSDVSLSCTATAAGKKIAGTIALKKQKLTSGKKKYTWTFTPKDSKNYKTASGTITLTVQNAWGLTASKGKVVLEKKVLDKIRKNAGSSAKAAFSIKDKSGKSLGTVKVCLKDVKAGQKLYLYRCGSKAGTYLMTDGSKYTVAKSGSLTMTIKEKGSYELLTSSKAATVNKKILSTVKLKTSSVTLKKGKSTKVQFSSSLDQKNVKKITYSSTNTKILKVSSKGTVTASKKGTAYVKVKVYLKNGNSKQLQMKIKVS